MEFGKIVDRAGREISGAVAGYRGDKKNLELEVRLGIYDMKNKRFSSNIGEENYLAIDSVLAGADWESTEESVSEDSFHKTPRGDIRVSRVAAGGKPDVEFAISKNKVFQRTFRVENLPLDIRVTLSEEIPVPLGDNLGEKTFSRTKDRKSRVSRDRAVYDLTRVTAGDEMTFEIEIEHRGEIADPVRDFHGVFHKAVTSNFIVDGMIMGNDHQIPIETVLFSAV